ncbi:MAG TPA: metallophosphoesterase [Polyangiaceae bacterium]
MSAGFFVFVVLMVAILAALNHHVYRWANRAFDLSRTGRRLLAGVLVSSLVLMTLGRVLDRYLKSSAVSDLLFAANLAELAVMISAILLLLVDLGALLGRLPNRILAFRARRAKGEPEEARPAELPTVTRRTLLVQAAAGSAFLVGGSSSVYGALVGRHDYHVEELPIHLPGLSKALDGFSILQLSDVHIGSFVGDPELEAGIELVRRARPDLIVLTGDLLDHDARFADMLGRFTRRLGPLARQGVVAITGNHDYYSGVEPIVGALERAGARVLRNRGEVIGGAQGFALLGVEDVWAKRIDPSIGPDLERAVRSLPTVDGKHVGRDLPRVLLCHNPSYFEHAAGHVQVQLSGHTHGGQVNLLVKPGELFMKNGWIAGLYERSGSHLYVNRGFGTAGPPARVGATPEITRVVLTA